MQIPHLPEAGRLQGRQPGREAVLQRDADEVFRLQAGNGLHEKVLVGHLRAQGPPETGGTAAQSKVLKATVCKTCKHEILVISASHLPRGVVGQGRSLARSLGHPISPRLPKCYLLCTDYLIYCYRFVHLKKKNNLKTRAWGRTIYSLLVVEVNAHYLLLALMAANTWHQGLCM